MIKNRFYKGYTLLIRKKLRAKNLRPNEIECYIVASDRWLVILWDSQISIN